MKEMSENEKRELYRIYEFASEAQYPELDLRCGTLDNYVETGILTREEVDMLWKQNAMRK
ncbi:MAG: hypothetical protein K6F00_01460 [Lachnospiraceae bacterium]|nr:hypothetical protein [Lachnospiraceae bacterium]